MTTKISASYYTFKNEWFQIENLNIKQYNFKISQKGTTGNLYKIICIDFFDPEQSNFQRNDMIIIDIDIVITKNWYDNFHDQDCQSLRSRPCLIGSLNRPLSTSQKVDFKVKVAF